MNRTCFHNLKISGVTGISNRVLIDTCGAQLLAGCRIEYAEIWIGEDCMEGAFSACQILSCVIRLHPNGPGRKAFVGCVFNAETEWDEQPNAK